MNRPKLIARRNFIRLTAAGASSMTLGNPLLTRGLAWSQPEVLLQTGEAPSANRPSTDLELMTPPAARTDRSIAVLWNRPASPGVITYNVHLDGKLIATTQHNDFTFDGLIPDREYELSVRSNGEGAAPSRSGTLRVKTQPPRRIVEVTQYGAVGDGKTLNTKAIQAAIAACGAGDLVRIPKGVFLSGALYVKSDITLLLDEDAVLLGSTETKDYPLMRYRWEGQEKTCYASLINTPAADGRRWKNISIIGSGTINANGVALRKAQLHEVKGAPGRAVCIRDTDGVYLQGVTVRQSPAWCVHLIFCADVSVNGVSIHTKYDEAGAKYANIVNGDGLDPDSCKNVFIFNSHIASEDDCIALKSGRDAEGRAVGIPTENVRISHCRFTSGFGVAMGSEMAGGLRNVLVMDCVFENTFSFASVKAPRGRGSVIEDITYRDCSHTNTSQEHHDSKWFRGALYVDQFYGVDSPDLLLAKQKDEGTSVIRNLLFQNITLDTVGGNAIYLAGLPESPLENVRLDNVTATGEHGFVAYNARGLKLNQVSVEARNGTAMRFINVT